MKLLVENACLTRFVGSEIKIGWTKPPSSQILVVGVGDDYSTPSPLLFWRTSGLVGQSIILMKRTETFARRWFSDIVWIWKSISFATSGRSITNRQSVAQPIKKQDS